MIAQVVQRFVHFLKDESGPTAVEYAMMLALIVVACLIAISALGSSTSATYDELSEKMAAAGS